MLPTRLHSVAVSLILHAALVGIGATSSSASSGRVPAVRLAALETAIAVEATDGDEGSSAAASAPSPPSTPAPTEGVSTEEAPAVRRRVHAVRPRLADPPAPAVVAPTPAPAPIAEPAVATPAPALATPALGAAPSTAGASESANVAAASPSGAPGGFAVGVGALGSAGGGGATTARAGGGPGSTEASEPRAEQLARYLSQVRTRVAQHREYPYLARRANLEGTICLRISIAASGRVLGVTPTCGESHEPLLDAALKSVSSAAPFPPLPAALGGRLTLDVPVVFELDAL